MNLALRETSYWLHQYRRTWRGTVVISIVNPLLFLTALGLGLGSLVDGSGGSRPGGLPYATFLAPGLLAGAAMQTAFIEGAFSVYNAVRGQQNYRATAATPLAPGHILGGHYLFIGFRLLTSCAAFALVMAAFGIDRSWRAAAVVGCATLTGLAFAAPLMALGAAAERHSTLMAVFRYLVMPMYFFCGTFFAVSQLPLWARSVVYLTPLWHGVALCRSMALGQGTAAMELLHTGVLLLFAAAGLLLAHRAYRRTLHG
ncbi:ABC transporter permease [Streptacidiphilus cavernicola]|uniref:Transport permease protein n=1 Tax=Streptacidiphilus cavernicola TaxID=3342716 RepID=A0ABV6VSL1_9ACTN